MNIITKKKIIKFWFTWYCTHLGWVLFQLYTPREYIKEGKKICKKNLSFSIQKDLIHFLKDGCNSTSTQIFRSLID